MQIRIDPITQVRDEVELIESLLQLDQRTLLELGCGSAQLTRRLATGGPGRQLIATEVDERAHALNCTIDDLPNVHFHLAGAEAIPLPAQSVDLVFMFKSLHHVPDELHDTVFRELVRVLKPGGLAWISEPIFAGEFNEVLRLFHDESSVRKQAFEAVVRNVEAGVMALVTQQFFLAPMHFPDFNTFEQRVIKATHTEHRLDPLLYAQVKAKFEGYCGADGAHFQMPIRVDLLRAPL